jgi:hypothetical protein
MLYNDAMITSPDYQTIRIWRRTLRMLRLIAALTNERMVQVLDRLVTEELRRISRTRAGASLTMRESLRKTYKFKLHPTPAQERLLDGIL